MLSERGSRAKPFDLSCGSRHAALDEGSLDFSQGPPKRTLVLI
jgi:hypothetical protein